MSSVLKCWFDVISRPEDRRTLHESQQQQGAADSPAVFLEGDRYPGSLRGHGVRPALSNSCRCDPARSVAGDPQYHDVPLRARQREPERTDLRSTADLCGQRHPASILITTAAGSEILESDPAAGRPSFLLA